MKKRVLISFSFIFLSGCAFFNTFYNARKSYNAGVESLRRANKIAQEQSISTRSISPNYYAFEPKTLPGDAKIFFDVAIEKSNKVVVLHGGSKWVEDAILLMGKSYYLRGAGNDYLDAKNRFEVFLTRYPNSKLLAEAKLWYGKTLIKLEQFDEAAEVLRQIPALITQPDIRAQALILLGDILLFDENYKVASDYYIQAVAAAKNDFIQRMALFKTAYVFYQMNYYSEATKYFDVLLKKNLSPNEEFELKFLKARAQKAAGLFDDGILTLDKLLGDLRHKNQFVRAEFEIGENLREKGLYGEAEKQYEYVIEEFTKHPQYSGDALYSIGLMHDSADGSKDPRFYSDPTLARKYYFMVRSKYPTALYAPDALRRLSYYERIDYLRGAIEIQNDYLAVVQVQVARLKGLDTSALPLAGESDIQTQPDTAGQKNQIQQKLSIKEEVRQVKLTNSELDNLVKKIQSEMKSAQSLVSQDSLVRISNNIGDRIADSHIAIAEYFFNEQILFDSAMVHYRYVVDQYPNSPSAEAAWFGIARVHQVKNDTSYKDHFQSAITRFPSSRFAPIARKIIGLQQVNEDYLRTRFEEAQKLMLEEKYPQEAFDLFKTIASNDTSRLRLPALFAMGLLCEKQLERPADAFRYYNSVAYSDPNSEFAKSAQRKIDGYKKVNQVVGDSAGVMIDTNYVKIKPVFSNPAVIKDTLNAVNTIDTTTVEISDKEIDAFEKLLKSKNEPRDSTQQKKDKLKQKPIKDDDIRHEE